MERSGWIWELISLKCLGSGGVFGYVMRGREELDRCVDFGRW